MRRPSKKLIAVSILALLIGYIVSWAIMVFVLNTEFRLYGHVYLGSTAFLVAGLLVLFLDTPLNLRAFDWPTPEEREEKDRGYYAFDVEWLITVDHKKIGIMYFFTGIVFLLIGTVFAFYMRTQLTMPGLQIFTQEQYDSFSKMHGLLMVFLGIIPILAAISNYFVPLQVGARSIALPRLNAFAFWLLLFSGILLYSGYIFSGDVGGDSFLYLILPANNYLPGLSARLWFAGATGVGLSVVINTISLLATIFGERAPGIGMHQIPVYSWMVVLQSTLYWLLLLTILPIIGGILTVLIQPSLTLDLVGSQEVSALWRHLSWFYAYPASFIMLLAAIGIVSDIVPVFARKPFSGYLTHVYLTVAIATTASIVWGYYIFIAGTEVSTQSFFAMVSLTIIAPMAIIVYKWLRTLLSRSTSFKTPLLFSLGFIIIFVIGGISAIYAASLPFDSQFDNDYTVAAYLHYVMFGGTIMAIFSTVYYWFPKVTGRMLNEFLGQMHCGLMLIGFTVMFFPMYFLGLVGMPRHIAEYEASSGWTGYNIAVTAGAYLIVASILPFLWNVIAAFSKDRQELSDPWQSNSLEWLTSSPPPAYNFLEIPHRSDELDSSTDHGASETATGPAATVTG